MKTKSLNNDTCWHVLNKSSETILWVLDTVGQVRRPPQSFRPAKIRGPSNTPGSNDYHYGRNLGNGDAFVTVPRPQAYSGTGGAGQAAFWTWDPRRGLLGGLQLGLRRGVAGGNLPSRVTRTPIPGFQPLSPASASEAEGFARGHRRAEGPLAQPWSPSGRTAGTSRAEMGRQSRKCPSGPGPASWPQPPPIAALARRVPWLLAGSQTSERRSLTRWYLRSRGLWQADT